MLTHDFSGFGLARCQARKNEKENKKKKRSKATLVGKRQVSNCNNLMVPFHHLRRQTKCLVDITSIAGSVFSPEVDMGCRGGDIWPDKILWPSCRLLWIE